MHVAWIRLDCIVKKHYSASFELCGCSDFLLNLMRYSLYMSLRLCRSSLRDAVD